MSDKRARRIAKLIEPLRVAPESTVDLAPDYDPAYKAGVRRKKDGVKLLQTGIALLADYQARLAARVTTVSSSVVAALESRSETATVLTTTTFDSKHMNWTLLGEFVLAVLVTQLDVFHRLLGTTDITLSQFGWALVPALALLVLWEAGKLVARRTTTPA